MSADCKAEIGWESLTEELDQWAESGRRATFWWRDDDAVSATGRLNRLLGISFSASVPLALAVIPGRLRPCLDKVLADAPMVRVIQHGFDHTNHASGTPIEGASELCLARGPKTILADLAEGLSRLNETFPGRVVPVLVPPWNRIDQGLISALPILGYRGLSTFGPRPAIMAAPGLIQINAHCDPIRWKAGRMFTGLSACLRAIIEQLRANRLCPPREAEPVGLLTHHLDLDEEAWDFTAEFIDRVGSHPAAAFCAVDALLVRE